jgi:hypothetical protein
MEKTQGDDENDYLAKVSDKLKEDLSSEPLPEEERAAMASVEKQVTEDLAKINSGKASTLASTQTKQGLKDEPFPASSSKGEGSEMEGYERPESKTYRERQVEPASFPEGDSYENVGRNPTPANISFPSPPLSPRPESVLEEMVPTLSNSDHVSGFDSRGEHFGEFKNF